jgi:uncharacterized protein with HEPN domain
MPLNLTDEQKGAIGWAKVCLEYIQQLSNEPYSEKNSYAMQLNFEVLKEVLPKEMVRSLAQEIPSISWKALSDLGEATSHHFYQISPQGFWDNLQENKEALDQLCVGTDSVRSSRQVKLQPFEPVSDKDLMGHIQHNIRKLSEFRDGRNVNSSTDAATNFACQQCIHNIGQAVKYLDNDFKNNNRTIFWKKYADARDSIIHDYDSIKPKAVKEIAKDAERILQPLINDLVLANYDVQTLKVHYAHEKTPIGPQLPPHRELTGAADEAIPQDVAHQEPAAATAAGSAGKRGSSPPLVPIASTRQRTEAIPAEAAVAAPDTAVELGSASPPLSHEAVFQRMFHNITNPPKPPPPQAATPPATGEDLGARSSSPPRSPRGGMSM